MRNAYRGKAGVARPPPDGDGQAPTDTNQMTAQTTAQTTTQTTSRRRIADRISAPDRNRRDLIPPEVSGFGSAWTPRWRPVEAGSWTTGRSADRRGLALFLRNREEPAMGEMIVTARRPRTSNTPGERGERSR